MKNIIIAGLVFALLGFGIFLFINSDPKMSDDRLETEVNTNNPSDSIEEEVVEQDKTKTVIGSSVKGNEITAYHYGTGDKEVLLVGGIHGGYSSNTSILAFELMDYFKDNANEIPANVKVTIIPVLNPDGLEVSYGTTGRFNPADVSPSATKKVEGRFNANGVDLNRNFACDWQEKAMWQSKSVSGGSSEFSEPESQALKSYIEGSKPSAVVVWYSSAGGVYASNCHNGVLPETKELTQVFAKASGYPAKEEFNFYEITGDAVNWMAKQNIPAISVLLTNHTDSEQSKNIKGVTAILELFAN